MKTSFLTISALALAICACTPENATETVVAESIELSNDVLELTRGTTFRLTAEVFPEDAEDKTVVWTSLNERIAAVDQDGLVTAVAIGETVIKAGCGPVSAECVVTVTAVQVEGVEVVPSEISVVRGKTAQLSVEITPEDADDRSVSWSSSDESVVLVDASGMISAVSIGEAVVTATVGDKSAECAVTVEGVPVEKISVSPEEMELIVGKTGSLTVTISPADADYDAVVWESSASQVASVDDGLVTALAPGEAVVTVSAAGKEASCAVTVKDVPEDPELSIGDIYFSDGTTSPVMVEGKTPIGVVFYVGDPSVDDGILRSEHPDCRNGLVVAMKDAGMAYWQLRFSIYQGRVGDWIASSSSGFMTTIADEDIINMMLGYNNTRAIEAFNAAEANWDWNVDALQPILDYRDAVPAPESSSGWYWPSPKELSLLCTGEYRDDISEIMNETDNLEVINGKLQAIGGEPLINTAPDGTSYGSYYWSSAESTSYQQAIYVLMSNGSVGPQSKGYPQRNLRCILAF